MQIEWELPGGDAEAYLLLSVIPPEGARRRTLENARQWVFATAGRQLLTLRLG